jgi:lipopolysaccharide export system permease protein
MILARYILSQLFAPLSFGLLVFSGVLLLNKVFDLIDLLVNKGVSFTTSAKMFLLFLPTVLSLTLPMSVLLACLLTFGRLSEDNEITALRASGRSFVQILWPPALVAAVLSIALIPFNTVLVPKSMSAFRSLYHSIVKSDPLIKLEPGRFIGIQNIRLFAKEVSSDNETMTDVFLYQFFKGGWQRIYAKRGTAQADEKRLFLNLEKGQLERLSSEDPETFLHAQFSAYTLSVPFVNPDSNRGRSWREMNLAELTNEIRIRQSSGVSPAPVKAELHLRFAIAFSPLALAMLGIPLGVALEKGGRGVGFGASLGIVFFYYLFLILGLTLAEKGLLPPGPALWTANAISGALGVFLYRRRLLR